MNIQFPLPEKVSTNKIYAGQHWTKRKKLADLYHNSLLPFRKLKAKDYPVNINYIFTFKSKPLDTTNCSYMVKLIEDGLVKNEILIDDSPEYVSFTGIYSQKGEEDLVEIIIA
jgi:hypothetical protein